jgi:hypothetical protein
MFLFEHVLEEMGRVLVNDTRVMQMRLRRAADRAMASPAPCHTPATSGPPGELRSLDSRGGGLSLREFFRSCYGVNL